MFKILDNTSYAEIMKMRPFGWEYDDPQTFESFEFERIEPFFWHDFITSYWKISYYASAIYVAVIFGLQRFMRDRPALKLKWPLFIWNTVLGIFSIVGFARTVPEFIHVLSQPNGLYNSICVKKGINIPSIYWGLLFSLSKFWELGDTVFIVLRKRPLIFLQWYHHIATLVVVWHAAPLVEPIARWYGILNFGVHSLMYPYFALKTVGVHVPSPVANFITTMQLAQMIIGFTVNMTSLYLLRDGFDCVRYPISIKAFNIVYGSFVFLFGKLFYDSVLSKNGKRRKLKVS